MQSERLKARTDQEYQAIWGVGRRCSEAERARPTTKDRHRQQRIIRYEGARNERRTDEQQAHNKVRTEPEKLGRTAGRGNGLDARPQTGAHDHLGREEGLSAKAGGGHCALAIGRGAAGSQDVASRGWALLSASSARRITPCALGSSGGASERCCVGGTHWLVLEGLLLTVRCRGGQQPVILSV